MVAHPGALGKIALRSCCLSAVLRRTREQLEQMWSQCVYIGLGRRYVWQKQSLLQMENANGVTRDSGMRDLHVASLEGYSFETWHKFVIFEQML